MEYLPKRDMVTTVIIQFRDMQNISRSRMVSDSGPFKSVSRHNRTTIAKDIKLQNNANT